MPADYPILDVFTIDIFEYVQKVLIDSMNCLSINPVEVTPPAALIVSHQPR